TFGLSAEWLVPAMQAVLARKRSRGSPRGEAELAKDVRDVSVDGVLAQDEPLSDLAVRSTLGDKPEHLSFALAEHRERGIGELRRSRRARRAELAEHG